MSKLRTKIAAGITILALAGLGGLAMSHPQPAPHLAAAGSTKQVTAPGTPVNAPGVEHEGADD